MSTVKPATEARRRERILVVVLRLSAVVLLLAFPMMLLPVEWMAATHRRLGLGEFPASPLTDYLARSISFLYGFHGGLLWLISTNLERYRGVAVYCVVMGIAFGVSIIPVDIHAGLPVRWIVGEGPMVIVVAAIVGFLLRSVPKNG